MINLKKIQDFIKFNSSKINETPVSFLNDMYNKKPNGLTTIEEDYIAYSIMYYLGQQRNYTYEFDISLLDGAPLGFSCQCNQNPLIYWYSDLSGDEDILWLKDFGWLDAIELPEKMLQYFRKFKISVVNSI